MTSFAFILGLLPLMLSTGVGAAGNKSIGTGAVGGMLIGTLFGVFVIPALFIIFQSLQERVSSKSPFDEGIVSEQPELEFPKADTREH
jgi:HAE1 family hydrophobic/amphiphilic exporter-1